MSSRLSKDEAYGGDAVLVTGNGTRHQCLHRAERMFKGGAPADGHAVLKRARRQRFHNDRAHKTRIR